MTDILRQRDLTLAYRKYRDEFIQKKNRFGYSLLRGLGEERLTTRQGYERLEANTIGDIELGDLHGSSQSSRSSSWLSSVEDVKNNISQIRGLLASLQKLHKRRLVQVFDEKSAKLIEDEMDSVSRNIASILRSSEGTVRSLTASPPQSANLSSADLLIVANAQRSLAATLQLLSQEARNCQTSYAKERASETGMSFAQDSVLDNEFNQTLSDHLLLDLEISIDERTADFSRLVTRISELGRIFKDFSSLVLEQGTILDRIDFNIEQIHQHTDRANIELKRTEKTQRTGVAAQCIKILLILIFMNILFLLFFRSR